MPLTKFQEALARLLSENRCPESHLAGGAAIHIDPQSIRYSKDLDYFNDSPELVASAYEKDFELLKKHSYSVDLEMRLPGYVRAIVRKKDNSTKVEWAADSAWRFMPVIQNEICGYMLHPIDLAVNKVLTLAGRQEPRDFLDTLYVAEHTLSLGALVWAAAGKDPGLNPQSLLELLKRRGKFQPEDFLRLHLKQNIDLKHVKNQWLSLLKEAEQFISERPKSEMGCLYYSKIKNTFVSPKTSKKVGKDYHLHFGRPGGIIPMLKETT